MSFAGTASEKPMEPQFEALLESAPDAILLVDARARIVLVNRRTEELFGYDRAELIGREVEALVPERFRRVHVGHRDGYIHEPRTRPMGAGLDLDGRRKDGSEFPVEISLSPLRLDEETLVITIVRDVSERKAAEMRFRTLLESAPDAILLVDEVGEIALVNRRTEELFGYPAEELLGQRVEALVPERFRGAHGHHRAVYVRAPKTRPMGAGLELFGRRKDGSEFPVEISLSPITSGDQTLVTTIIRDISERKAAETERLELARAQAAKVEAETAASRLRSLQAVTEAALGHLTLDELLAAVLEPVQESLASEAATILLLDETRGALVARASIGLESEVEAAVAVPIGSGIAGRIAAERAAGIFDSLEQAVSPMLRASGFRSLVGAPLLLGGDLLGVIEAGTAPPRRFTDDDAQLLQLFADRIALAIGQARLYEAERQAHAAAEAAQARLGEIMGDLDAIVWEADTPERPRFTFVGGRAEELLGYPLTRWTTEEHFWSTLIHPDDRERARLLSAEAAAVRRDHELEYRVQAADGRLVWVRDIVRVSAPDGAAGVRLRGMMVDVTQRRELEGRLLQSQKMEAVGQLAGGIAHDFNNLVTIISGFAKLLAARLDDEQARAELAEIEAAAARAAALTGQLLAFSRRGPHTSELFDVSELVSGIEKMLRRVIGEDIELTIRPSPEPLRIEADRGQLEQALVNLVVNASDAMPRGGSICISTSATELTDEAAARVELSPGHYVQLSVTDTGVGMSKETMDRIFEPFFTTKPAGEGTGLGLATVFGIVEQAGGRTTVASEVGRGSEFSLYLPAAPAEVERDEQWAATILLAEDEPALRKLARLILEQEQYRVLEAKNGREALEIAERLDAPIDVLLTDVVMPELNGPDLVARLRAVRPDLSVIYMSGYADSRLAGRGISEEGASIVRKPFDAEELQETVRRTLASRS